MMNDLIPVDNTTPAWAEPFQQRVQTAAAQTSNAMMKLALVVAEMTAAAAAAKAPRGEVARLLHNWGGYSRSEVSKLATVGSDEVLINCATVLPPHLDTAYLLTQIEDPEQREVLACKPTLRRSELRDLIDEMKADAGVVVAPKTARLSLSSPEVKTALERLGVWPARSVVVNALVEMAVESMTAGVTDEAAIETARTLAKQAGDLLLAKDVTPMADEVPVAKRARSSAERAAQVLTSAPATGGIAPQMADAQYEALAAQAAAAPAKPANAKPAKAKPAKGGGTVVRLPGMTMSFSAPAKTKPAKTKPAKAAKPAKTTVVTGTGSTFGGALNDALTRSLSSAILPVTMEQVMAAGAEAQAAIARKDAKEAKRLTAIALELDKRLKAQSN